MLSCDLAGPNRYRRLHYCTMNQQRHHHHLPRNRSWYYASIELRRHRVTSNILVHIDAENLDWRRRQTPQQQKCWCKHKLRIITFFLSSFSYQGMDSSLSTVKKAISTTTRDSWFGKRYSRNSTTSICRWHLACGLRLGAVICLGVVDGFLDVHSFEGSRGFDW